VGEREVEEAGGQGGVGWWPGVGGELPGLVEIVSLLLPSGPLYVVGRGRGRPYPSTKAPRAGPRGEAAAKPGPADPPQTLTLTLGRLEP
jgi:hypothetical protein